MPDCRDAKLIRQTDGPGTLHVRPKWTGKVVLTCQCGYASNGWVDVNTIKAEVFTHYVVPLLRSARYGR